LFLARVAREDLSRAGGNGLRCEEETEMTDAIITLWRRGFLRALNRGGDVQIDDQALRIRAAQLGARRGFPGGGAQTAFNEALATGLHAAAELLEEAGLDRRAARDRAGAAFLQSGKGLAHWLTRAWLWTASDPVGQAQDGDRLSARARLIWGAGMRFHQENGPDHATLKVTECAFADYFWDAGRSDLTPILCAWDAQWMEIVNASDRPVSVSRSGTLAQGCDVCDFCLRRVPAEEMALPVWHPHSAR
jgi:hypothetical protein